MNGERRLGRESLENAEKQLEQPALRRPDAQARTGSPSRR